MRILEKQISDHQMRAKQMGEKEKGVLGEINSLDQKKKVIEQRIKVIELKLEKVKNTIAGLHAEVRLTEGELGEMTEILENRLVDIYKYGGVAEFNLLLSSASAHEAMEMSYLLHKIALQDEALIREMLLKKDRLLKAAEQMKRQEKSWRPTPVTGERKSTGRISKSNAFLDKVRGEIAPRAGGKGAAAVPERDTADCYGPDEEKTGRGGQGNA